MARLDDEFLDFDEEELEEELNEDGQNEEDGKENLAEAVEKGGKCELKAVYHAPVKGDPLKFEWVDEKPLDIHTTDNMKTKKERESFAVVNYYKNRDFEWVITQIKINNAKIQTALEKVLEGYPGLTQYELNDFQPPYHPFFHRWDQFLSYISAESDTSSRQYLTLLRNILEPQLQDSFRRAKQFQETGHVSFDDLDLVFYPGSLAYHSSRGLQAAGVFRNGAYGMTHCGERYWDAHVDVVDWDGRKCGLLSEPWRVWEYQGLRAITALDVSPLDSHADKEDIRFSLIKRGRTFEKLRGQSFMAYTDEHEDRRNERTVIDARAYHKHGPPYAEPFPSFASLDEIGPLTWEQSMNRYSSNPNETTTDIDLSPLTDEQCLLAVATVKCFNIETKKWDKLDLLKFHEIPWSERAFDSLVLDPEEKDLLLALVDREEFKNSKAFDDFISGKGQGMIMLLCGPPGVGKTLTAESVAEHLRRPLYKVGAGDLGISSYSVENCLKKALQLCSHWGAVLLIDEADVFMEARTADNLQRNELVSIFLRLLEYYSGIMILTTNRMRSIDTAFESRVDITLTYNSLTEADRMQVWRNFLRHLDPKDHDIDEAGIKKLAKWDFNGRQIKSAIKTARILAAKKKVPLNSGHLNVVLNLRAKAIEMSKGGEPSMNGTNGINGTKTNGV